jgi:hypothetical protein
VAESGSIYPKMGFPYNPHKCPKGNDGVLKRLFQHFEINVLKERLFLVQNTILGCEPLHPVLLTSGGSPTKRSLHGEWWK